MNFLNDHLAELGGGALAIMALSALVYKTIGQIRRIGHFLDDWFGEAERPGIEARPGVTARLATIEAEQSRVRREFEHNGGGSLKDAVKRVEMEQAAHAAALATLTGLLGQFAHNEQTARTAGHQASEAAWNAVEKLADNEPESPKGS